MEKSNGFKETVFLVVVFIILWKSGFLDTSFEIILSLGTFLCFIGFVAEHTYFKKKRIEKAKIYKEEETKANESLKTNGVNREQIIEEKTKDILKRPKYLDWTSDLFPLVFVIFIIRSFIVEPFTIPSGSMMPTLIKGDNILVSKYSYGVKLPVVWNTLIGGSDVKRGDIVVFHYPLEPRVNYIKRAIGLPGDTIEYKNKELFINGTKIVEEKMEDYTYPKEPKVTLQFNENLLGVNHRILIEPNASGTITKVLSKSASDNCEYAEEYVKCVVPKNEYFMMGDNRDGSLDSRYWGFVPEKNLVGKAFYIWSNWGDMSRFGSIK